MVNITAMSLILS